MMMIMISFLLAGCSKEYIYTQPKPFKFQTTLQPKVREIRIYNKDIKLYEAYILQFREIIQYHNSQIDDYFMSFDDNKSEIK